MYKMDHTYSSYFAAQVLKIDTKFKQCVYDLANIILGNILLILSSKISFFLPFTPVPITMQTFAVLFLSTIFGRKAVYIVGLYILEGLTGLPVFAKGTGFGYLFGPTGGYIIGFLVASYVCGLFSELGYSKSFVRTFFAMVIGNILIYLFGIFWLMFYTNFNLLKALMLGVVPFIIGDVFKIVLLTFILPFGWKLIK